MYHLIITGYNMYRVYSFRPRCIVHLQREGLVFVSGFAHAFLLNAMCASWTYSVKRGVGNE
jgi:hypothetical protein